MADPSTLRDAAVEVHNLATPGARFDMSTVALAQVDLPGRPSEFFASGSRGELSPDQIALLRELGVPETNILLGEAGHAEQNIINAMLPEGSTISR